jgi:hypothetical protein
MEKFNLKLKKKQDSVFFDLRSRSKITGTFYRGLGGAFGFAGSLQSYGFAPLRQPQNSSPIPSV